MNEAVYARSSHRWKEITKPVVHFVAEEVFPVSTVEKPGFVRMVKKLDLKYEVPLRKYFSKTTLPLL